MFILKERASHEGGVPYDFLTHALVSVIKVKPIVYCMVNIYFITIAETILSLKFALQF